MFKRGDIVQIKSGQKNWEKSFGQGVFDVVLRVATPEHAGCVVSEIVSDPHGSFSDRKLIGGKVRAYEQDLISRTHIKEELLSIRKEIGV